MNEKIYLLVLGILTAPLADAKPSCRLDLSKEPYYRLELTVPATFCKGKVNRNDLSCKQFPKEGAIQLHGLWPNYEHGYPEGKCGSKKECPIAASYCSYIKPPDLYTSEGWKNLKGYMAGTEKCLERHEWVKHGVCAPMAAPQYFEWSLSKAKEISDALDSLVGKNVTREDFNNVIDKKLHEVNGAVRLKCNGQNLYSMSIFYQWGETPQAVIPTTSGENAFGNCSNSFVIPTKP